VQADWLLWLSHPRVVGVGCIAGLLTLALLGVGIGFFIVGMLMKMPENRLKRGDSITLALVCLLFSAIFGVVTVGFIHGANRREEIPLNYFATVGLAETIALGLAVLAIWRLCLLISPRLTWLKTAGGIALILVVGGALPGGLLWIGQDARTIQPQHVIYNPVAQTAQLVTHQTRLWRRNLTGCRVFPAQMEKIAVVMTLHPITPNPKVRDIRYHVILRAKDTPTEQDLARWQATAATDDIRRKVSWKVQWRLYNLNDERSKELSRFSNPLDSDQQALFARLVRPAVKEVLPSWMEIESISFHLP